MGIYVGIIDDAAINIGKNERNLFPRTTQNTIARHCASAVFLQLFKKPRIRFATQPVPAVSSLQQIGVGKRNAVSRTEFHEKSAPFVA